MIPLEFSIVGTPVSQQTRNRQRLAAWRQAVNVAAAAVADGRPPVQFEVDVRITYFYIDAAPDVDNIVKPILDGMCGVVYDDDERVIDVRSGKRNLDGSFRVRGMSQAVADGFISGSDFVHVRVVSPDDQTELP